MEFVGHGCQQYMARRQNGKHVAGQHNEWSLVMAKYDGVHRKKIVVVSAIRHHHEQRRRDFSPFSMVQNFRRSRNFC
jgi:hypothetical protein